jgi:hypothetical protein
MEATCSSDTSVLNYKTASCHKSHHHNITTPSLFIVLLKNYKFISITVLKHSKENFNFLIKNITHNENTTRTYTVFAPRGSVAG